MERILIFLPFLVVVAANLQQYRVCSHTPEPMMNITYVDTKLGYDFKGRSSSSHFEQFRIVVYKSLEGLDESKKQVVEKLIETAVKYWSEALKVRRLTEPLRLYRKCTGQSYFKVGTKQCCASASCGQTMCGEVVVPEEHLRSCCDERGIDLQGTETEGVPDADFVLYVSAINSDNCGRSRTAAYATYCEQEPDFDRPVAGAANICPHAISTEEMEEKRILSTVKHELVHALGFSSGLYPFYRDAEGKPLTPRLNNGFPSLGANRHFLGLAQWSDRVVRQITRKWKVRGGVMDKTAHYLVTPKVVAEVREHFDCPELEGAELEDQGGTGTALSHFEKRVFGNELMTGIETDRSSYSRLTFALLEDTGWYKADYSKAQPLQYGYKLGCEFCMRSCKEWMDERRSNDEDLYPFCEVAREERCSSSHHAAVACILHRYQRPLPKLYQNFDSLPNIPKADLDLYGGLEQSDFCPTFAEYNVNLTGNRGSYRSTCADRNDMSEDELLLQTFGENTKCFDLTNEWSMTECRGHCVHSVWGSSQCSYSVRASRSVAGCFKYSCSAGKVYVELADRSLPCFYRDQQLPVQILKNNELNKLTIICPACDVICDDEGDACNADDKNAAKRHKYGNDTCSSSKLAPPYSFLLLPAMGFAFNVIK